MGKVNSRNPEDSAVADRITPQKIDSKAVLQFFIYPCQDQEYFKSWQFFLHHGSLGGEESKPMVLSVEANLSTFHKQIVSLN